MSRNDFRRGINIYLETSEYKKGIDELRKKTKELEKEYENLTQETERMTQAGQNSGRAWQQLQREGKKLSREIVKNKNAIASYQEGLENTKRVLDNLSGATYNDLTRVKRILYNELKRLDRGSQRYRQTLEHYNRVSKETTKAQREMNSTLGRGTHRFGKLTDGFNRYIGVVGAGLATITGMSYTFRRLAEQVAQLDDVYADVMKTTGLTREQVLKLNAAFAEMDTRTPREQLNRLAYDAGKLGLTASEDILAFVDAANQIEVALGEDLGEDATRMIGKMVNVFEKSTQHLQRLGLREQMLAVGSAINELGADSNASEAYLVQFGGRLGGVAAQAGISIDKILGFASALDQNMQQVEMSATALQHFITQVMGQPAKFAEIAGIEVEKFNKLVREDTNKAIKTVLRSLGEKGGFEALIPIFEDLGLNGQRLISVLSSLASNVEQIDRAQEVASAALIKGTSLTEEYSIKNETLQARLDKAREAFKRTATELGEKLSPALLKSTNMTTHLIRAFVKYPSIFKTLLYLLGAVATAYALKTAAVVRDTVVTQANLLKSRALLALQQLQILWNKRHTLSITGLSLAKALLTGNIGKARVAFSLLTKTMNANVFVAIATVVVSLGSAIWNLSQRIWGLTEAQKAMQDSIASETVELNKLFTAYENANKGSELKEELMKKIKAEYGDYLTHLMDEKGHLTDIAAAQQIANAQLQRNIALKSKEQEATRIETEYVGGMAKLLTEVKEDIMKQDGGHKDVADVIVEEVKAYFDTLPTDARVGDARRHLRDNIYQGSGIELKEGFNPIVQRLYDEAMKRQKALSQSEGFYAPFIEGGTDPFEIHQPNDGRDHPKKRKKKGKTPTYTPTSGKPSDPYREELSSMEIVHKREQLAIRKRGGDEEYDKLLQSEEQFLRRKIALQKQYNQETIETEIALFDNRQKQAKSSEERLLLSMQVSYQETQRITDTYYQQEQEKLQSQLENQELTHEEYEAKRYALDLQVAERKKRDAQAYHEALMTDESLSREVREKAIKEVERTIAQVEGQITKLQSDEQNRRRKAHEKELREIERLRRELGLDREKLGYREGLDALKDKLKKAQATEEETADAIYRYKVQKAQQYANIAKQLTDGLGSFVKQHQELETAQLQAEKQKQLQAVGNNASQRQQIEQQFAQKELDLKKKQANADMAINISKALVNGALAVSNILANHAANPFVSVPLIAATAATMALQVGTIIAQRNAIMSTTLESASAGGGGDNAMPQGKLVATPQAADGRWDVVGADDGRTYTNVPFRGRVGTGVVGTPTLIAERGDELIVDSPTLNNIRMNAPHIIEQILQHRIVPQREQGNYQPIAQEEVSLTRYESDTSLREVMERMTHQLDWLQKHKIEARVVLSELDKQRHLYEQSIQTGARR